MYRDFIVQMSRGHNTVKNRIASQLEDSKFGVAGSKMENRLVIIVKCYGGW